MSLDERLSAIRTRIERLAKRDIDCVVFGATRHEWRLAPPLPPGELETLESRHGVAFPDEVRAWLTAVAASGAGPYYGLVDIRETTAELGGEWVGEVQAQEADSALHRGHVVIADQGCGYRSVLVLTGSRRGEVFADMRGALEGFRREAASFLDWYEEWLDRALAEWAAEELPSIVGDPDWGRDDDIEAAAPILERRADLTAPRTAHDALYPVSEVERMRALILLRVYQRKFDDALALIAHARSIDERDAEAQAQLATARVHAARGDHAARLAAIEAGLLDTAAWLSTRSELMRERVRALTALGRVGEAGDAILAVARDSNSRDDWYDAAWMSLEQEDVDGAAAILLEAAARKARSGDAVLAVDFAEPLFDALVRADRASVAELLRARLAPGVP